MVIPEQLAFDMAIRRTDGVSVVRRGSGLCMSPLWLHSRVASAFLTLARVGDSLP